MIFIGVTVIKRLMNVENLDIPNTVMPLFSLVLGRTKF